MQNGEPLLDLVPIITGFIELMLFPLITFALGWFVQTIRRSVKFRVFRRVFGRVTEDPEDIIISIPLWRVKDASPDTPRFEKTGLDGNERRAYGPDETVSYDDLMACAQVASILAEFYPRPVTYSLDNDRRLELGQKTIIMVGAPLANIRARSVFSIVEQPYLEYVEQEETAEHEARTAIRDKRADVLYDCSGDREYSMVLRVPNYRTPRAYFFLISGPHAEGTLAAAMFLKDHWEDFKDADDMAGVLLGMPRAEVDKREVVMRYGFPEH